MEKVRCVDMCTCIVEHKMVCTDAASRKRTHEEESEGGPAIKKPASESHGETICIYLCLVNQSTILIVSILIIRSADVMAASILIFAILVISANFKR